MLEAIAVLMGIAGSITADSAAAQASIIAVSAIADLTIAEGSPTPASLIEAVLADSMAVAADLTKVLSASDLTMASAVSITASATEASSILVSGLTMASATEVSSILVSDSTVASATEVSVTGVSAIRASAIEALDQADLVMEDITADATSRLFQIK